MTDNILTSRFKTKLEINAELNGIVNTTISNFGEIYRDNRLYFFSEYTDHGLKHIQNVLTSSDDLIPDSTFNNILKDKDIAYYILSIILHDIGMHINLEGFLCLIEGEYDTIRIKELDKYTWKELWEDFFIESKKFSGKQLKSIFGDENAIIELPPFSKPGEINENHKKLIGEFIRRHHARIAHEIAINGFPAKPEILEFAVGLDLKIRNMIGLIARSHGMALRKCADYVESEYGKQVRRTPCDCHAIYLMVLLRIADYIQIDNTRTSKTLLKIKTFSSPISGTEHNAHLAIDSVDLKYQDDPESIFVTASPDDSIMYLKLTNLIKDIQYELDISWAVLGELYGRLTENRPEIKYRRITSNMENEIFISKQEYIADNIFFKANDEIIKLLIAPLYGDNPTYGVRELIQNAVDACKEREVIENKNGNQEYKPSIIVEIIKDEKKDAYFIISDNGIGMDVDVIKNYFLSAGASYRKSIEWQKKFVDLKGSIKVRRNGRFGIGVLAAFLIGKEIEVETKKININGYKFKADINTVQINILKTDGLEVGTIIKIKIDNETLEKFEIKNTYYGSGYINWNEWYTLSKPQIKYLLFNKELKAFNEKFDPDINEELPKTWNAIDSDGFNKVLWTYSEDFTKIEFSCNGIVIEKNNFGLNNYYSDTFLDLGLISDVPIISVFDNDATLPLTLNRNSFSDKLTFANDLKEDIYKDFIAYLLTIKNISEVKENCVHLYKLKLKYPGTYLKYGGSSFSYGFNLYDENIDNGRDLKQIIDSVLISKKGFIINYNYFIQKSDVKNAIFIQSENFSTLEIQNINKKNYFIELDIKDQFILLSDDKLNSIEDYKIAIDAKQFNATKSTFEPFNSRVFMKTEKYKHVFNKGKQRISRLLDDKCDFQFEKFGWSCLHFDNPKESLISDAFLEKYSENINFIREYEITCPFEGDNVLNKLLQKYIGDDVVIPFSINDRREKYPLAFNELERYMRKYL